LSKTINTKALLEILPSQRLVKKSEKPTMLWYKLVILMAVSDS